MAFKIGDIVTWDSQSAGSTARSSRSPTKLGRPEMRLASDLDAEDRALLAALAAGGRGRFRVTSDGRGIWFEPDGNDDRCPLCGAEMPCMKSPEGEKEHGQ